MYRVLLVDDEPIALDSLEYMLRKNRKDIEVVGKARSGRDAVEKAYNARPDIVLMDINMPGINGLEAIRRIKETNSSAQFIITTAFDYFDYAVEAMELQATEYLLKPIREAKLLEVMEKVTARVDARREQLRKELEIKEKFEIIVPMMETGFINALCMFEDSEEELQRYHYLLGITGKGGYVMIIAFEDKDSGGGNNRVGAGVRGQALYSRYREVLKATCSCIVGPIMLNRVVVYICEGRCRLNRRLPP
ncbi:MAG: response regulator [Anaeromassilibacillus sp.]